MKYILILGAKSDVAISLIEILAKNKHNLILAAKDISKIEAYSSDLKKKNNIDILLEEIDVTDLNKAKLSINKLLLSIIGVISFVGYNPSQQNILKNFEVTKKIYEINFLGIVNVIAPIFNNFNQIGNGFIIVLTSVAGDRARKSNFIYGGAKNSLSFYLDGLRQSTNNNRIKIIDIRPGFIKTKMTKDLSLPSLITSNPEEVANIIFKSINKNKKIIYVKFYWKYIMFIIRLLPNFLLKKLNL